jgi:hypothetical protein
MKRSDEVPNRHPNPLRRKGKACVSGQPQSLLQMKLGAGIKPRGLHIAGTLNYAINPPGVLSLSAKFLFTRARLPPENHPRRAIP